MQFMKDIWDKLDPLEKRQYAMAMNTKFMRDLAELHITVAMANIANIDSAQPDFVSKFVAEQNILRFWQEFLQFLSYINKQ